MFSMVYGYRPLCCGCPFFIVYQAKSLLKPAEPTDDSEESGLSSMRGKHHKKDKYDVGVNEALKIIQCYNPLVYNVITSCGIPFLDARRVVRRLINSSITNKGLNEYDYSCLPW